ncbi:MAG: hypothetical protein KAV87_55135 [Desulfobacteraceae bacterium]|nr:hypothetical protein [Desulfobacteraceae bacterium]
MEISIIPAFIRDLANTMVANGYSSPQGLNRRLRSLGWDDFELDDYTLQLIIAILEPDLAYKPPHWFDRSFDPKRLNKLAEEKHMPVVQIRHNKPSQE